MVDNVFKLAQIQAQRNGHDKWIKLRRMAQDYYDGLTQEYTKQYYTPKSLQWLSVANHNITKRIINRISLVYMVPPIRTVDGSVSEAYNKLVQSKDEKMQRVERLTNLLGVVAIRPVWDADKQAFDYYIITDFEVQTSPVDPLRAIGIRYPTAAPSTLSDTSEDIYQYIDEQVSYLEDANGKQITEAVPHEYGVLPVIFSFRDGVPETMFLDVYPALDIIEANLGINIMLTDLRMNLRFQGHGKYWGKGIDPATNISLSPQVVSIFESAESELNVLSPPNMTDAAINAIKNEYRLISTAYGLDPNVLEGNTAQSGVALRIRNQELLDNRKEDVTRMRKLEQAIYVVEKAVIGVDAPKYVKALGDNLAVDYQEATNILTPQEQREQDNWDLEHNLITPVDILKRRNPDIEDPEEVIRNNRAINTGAASLEEVLNV